jgi:hypothetical protein
VIIIQRPRFRPANRTLAILCEPMRTDHFPPSPAGAGRARQVQEDHSLPQRCAALPTVSRPEGKNNFVFVYIYVGLLVILCY